MGIYLTDLADAARSSGLTVVEVAGWRTRGWRGGDTPDGGMLSRPKGGLTHHTGTALSAQGSYPSLNLVINGRVGVAGPLAQLGLGRDGTVYVIAAGRTNHAGVVDDWRYSNPYAIGIEAEHPGGTVPWDPHMYNAYVQLCAALDKWYGITWRGHKEAAIPYGRKPDPTFDMNQFRLDVAREDSVTTAPEEVVDKMLAFGKVGDIATVYVGDGMTRRPLTAGEFEAMKFMLNGKWFLCKSTEVVVFSDEASINGGLGVLVKDPVVNVGDITVKAEVSEADKDDISTRSAVKTVATMPRTLG